MERALDDLALDVPAEPEVCTEVFAVGVHHGHPAGLRPPRDQLVSKYFIGVHGADADLVRPGDLEPSGRLHRERRLRHGTRIIVGSMKIWKKVLRIP